MQFNQKALDAKMKHLDEIKIYPDVLSRVIDRNIKDSYTLTELNRIWTGGGGTPYLIETEKEKFFLKIKHKAVTVESKVEEEEFFIDEPCIEHEMHMLKKAHSIGVNVPRIIFFDEEENFQFLATEFVSESFSDYLQNSSLEQVVSLWEDLQKNVRLLFENGIVHSDIHEYNLRVANNKVVMIDFEESRELKQNCIFEKSIDYVGKNSVSSLGEFPLAYKEDYTVKLNSLLRMRQLLKKYLIPKVIEYIKECNYDSTTGICTALDHGHSDLTYQSIQNNWISVKGQRELNDNRSKLISLIIRTLGISENYTFVDVGSNNGLFCREISRESDGKIRCIGLEGFHKFNVLAKALAIIEECENICYYDFLCGLDKFDNLCISTPCFFNLCSVWHHIKNKSLFVDQMKKCDIQYVFLEMPVQKECYEGRTWEEEVNRVKKSLGFKDQIILGNSRDYCRPMILLSKNLIDITIGNKICDIAKNELKSI